MVAKNHPISPNILPGAVWRPAADDNDEDDISPSVIALSGVFAPPPPPDKKPHIVTGAEGIKWWLFAKHYLQNGKKGGE